MNALSKAEQPVASDLRMRYVPGVRIRHGLLGMAPWLDMALIVFYLVLLQARVVLQPGLVVELPAASSDAGLYSSLVAVAVVAGAPRAPVYKVFFDNEQYGLDDEKRMERFRVALAAKRQQHGETALTLYADRRIENRHLTLLMQIAREAGMQRINLGTRPTDGRP